MPVGPSRAHQAHHRNSALTGTHATDEQLVRPLKCHWTNLPLDAVVVWRQTPVVVSASRRPRLDCMALAVPELFGTPARCRSDHPYPSAQVAREEPIRLSLGLDARFFIGISGYLGTHDRLGISTPALASRSHCAPIAPCETAGVSHHDKLLLMRLR